MESPQQFEVSMRRVLNERPVFCLVRARRCEREGERGMPAYF